MEAQENNDIIVIENYLEGKLSEHEKEHFLLRMKSDRELEKLYRFRLKIRDDWQKAHQYDATRQQIKGAVLREKSQQRRTIMYAVAASLALMIVVSGIFNMVSQRNEPAEMASAKTDTTVVETYEPQINQPKSYADSGEYVATELTLTVTINTDSLVFNWQPQSQNETYLVIISQEGKKELFRKQIQPESQKISLPRNQIPTGKLIWYIEGFAARDSFEITNIK